jgi:hypothetical protein
MLAVQIPTQEDGKTTFSACPLNASIDIVTLVLSTLVLGA